MPPRKSNTSQIPTTADEATPTKDKDGVNIEDLALPRTMVQRLAKGVLPPNTQIQKDAITAMSKSATVFVNYLSQAANTSTISSSRKTISPEAVLDALAELEFEDFLPRVQAELRRFNEVQTGKRNEYRRKLKEKEGTENGVPVARSGGGKVVDKGHGDEDGEERAAKRVRREGAPEVVNGASSNSADKGVTEEEIEEEDEEEEEAGKEDTIEDEGADDDEGMEEEDEEEEDDDEDEDEDEDENENEEDNTAGEASGEERATDQDELDEADLDERTEVEDEEQSSDDSE